MVFISDARSNWRTVYEPRSSVAMMFFAFAVAAPLRSQQCSRNASKAQAPRCCLRAPVTSLRRGALRRERARDGPEPKSTNVEETSEKQSTQKKSSRQPAKSDKSRIHDKSHTAPSLRRTGFNSAIILSAELADTMTDGKRVMSRAEVASHISKYVKEHNLKDPSDGRMFLFDDNMSNLFPDAPSKVFFRAITALLRKHIIPVKNASPELARAVEEYTRKLMDTPRKVKIPKRRRKTRQNEKGVILQGRMREQKRGLFIPVQVSQELSDVCDGVSSLSRPEITSHVWRYIRQHNLQDKEQKRKIWTDDKLKRICDNAESVDCFHLSSFVARHIKSAK